MVSNLMGDAGAGAADLGAARRLCAVAALTLCYLYPRASPRPTDFRSDISRAEPGDVITVPPGSWGGLVVTRGGEPGRPVVIRAECAGSAIFSHIDVEADWVTFEGLVVDPSAGRAGGRTPGFLWAVEGKVIDNRGRKRDAVSIKGKNVTYRRCEILNGRKDGIDIGGKCRDILIEECRIHDFISDDDCHGVVLDSAIDTIIRKNEIWNCSGDCVQVITGKSEGTVIEENHLYVEPEKAELCENAVDIKSTRGVVIRLNRMHGFRRPKRKSSDGTAIVVHDDADNVVIEGNEIWDSSGGVRIGDTAKGTPDDCIIRRNIFRDLPRGARHGIQVSGTKNLKVLNNTFYNADPAVTEFEKNPGLVVKNNLLVGSRMRRLSGDVKMNKQLGKGAAAGAFFDAAGRDFRLRAGSGLVDIGLVVEGLEYEGSAPDVGAFELGWEKPVLVTTTADLRKRRPQKKKAAADPLAAELKALRRLRELKEKKKAEAEATVDRARADELRRELREWVVQGAAAGKREKLMVEVLGMRQRGTVARADEDGVFVELPGGGLQMPWNDLPDERFYRLVRKYAADSAKAHELLGDFCEAAGLDELAQGEREKARGK